MGIDVNYNTLNYRDQKEFDYFFATAFDRYDKNHDGVIDFKEFQPLINDMLQIVTKKYGYGPSVEKIRAAWSSLDFDRNGYLTRNEFSTKARYELERILTQPDYIPRGYVANNNYSNYNNIQKTFSQGGYNNYNNQTYSQNSYSSTGYSSQGCPPLGYGQTGFTQPYFPQGYSSGGPNQDYSSPGYSNQGYSNQGYSSQGYSNQGYPNQGYSSQGYSSQGYPNQGYPNKGFNSAEMNGGFNSNVQGQGF